MSEITFNITHDEYDRPYTKSRLRKMQAEADARKSAKKPAEIHHMTRQQRRAAERKGATPQ